LPLGGALISPATTPHLEGVGDSQLVLAVPASPNQVEPLRTRLAMAQGSVTTAVTTIDEQLADARQSSDMIRRAITAALVLATLIAAVSLVVTLLDRMLAGGRSLAALRAAGLPLAVLRRAALGETALVVVPAVMLGVLVAAPCAAALLTVDGTGSLSVDWRTAGLVGGAAVSLVLAVNLLLLPAVKHVATTTVLADD
jgi:uncharacterized membrane protein YgcG